MQIYVHAELAIGECHTNTYPCEYHIASFTRRKKKKYEICIEISDLIMTMVTDVIVLKTLTT